MAPSASGGGAAPRQRKRLDPNPLAAPWELRLGAYRVFYDVDEVTQEVLVLRDVRERARRPVGTISAEEPERRRP